MPMPAYTYCVNTPFSAQERVLEYLIFHYMNCQFASDCLVSRSSATRWCQSSVGRSVARDRALGGARELGFGDGRGASLDRGSVVFERFVASVGGEGDVAEDLMCAVVASEDAPRLAKA